MRKASWKSTSMIDMKQKPHKKNVLKHNTNIKFRQRELWPATLTTRNKIKTFKLSSVTKKYNNKSQKNVTTEKKNNMLQYGHVQRMLEHKKQKSIRKNFQKKIKKNVLK